jgi:hypothetical protein
VIEMQNMARRGTIDGIDLAELEKLCGLQCTNEEIAAWFGVTTGMIERRRKVRKFADVMDRGKAKGRISVRRQQMKLLEAGNATMGVWLGKNILGQADEVRHQIGGAAPFLLVLSHGPSDTSKQVLESESEECVIDVKRIE